MNKNIFEFPVVIYGNLEKFNDVLSKARCRIFYKYGNRNGTYITDEFAEKLVNSLHYVPIKGIYDEDEKDFTDHGKSRGEGRIYGIVPETNNFAWEKHLDEDGVEREYACADVLIFTSLYSEASEIVGKAQSMELFEPTLKYHFEVIKGVKWAVFEDGCFLGLQALGDNVEPCFEGSAFYTLQSSIEQIVNKIKEYTLNYQLKGGKTEMPKINFKLSDDDKFSALWSLLNTEYNEESGWMVTYGIVSIYDAYAVVRSYETGDYERVYYTKDDEKDSVTINSKEKCFIVDVSEKERATLDTLRGLNGGSYELVSDSLTNAQENSEKVLEFSTKIEELNTSISTLTTERDDSITEHSLAKEQISTLTEELGSLKVYKLGIEAEQKEAVLVEYEAQLSDEVIETYRKKLADYTALELDKELAYELKKTNPSVFTKTPGTGYVPKDDPRGGIEEILLKYKK